MTSEPRQIKGPHHVHIIPVSPFLRGQDGKKEKENSGCAVLNPVPLYSVSHGSDAPRSESDARQACRWIVASKETVVTHFLSLPPPTTTFKCVRVSETSICCLMFQLTKFRVPKYRQTLQNAFCLKCACFIFLSIFNQHRGREKELSDPQTLVKIIIRIWNSISPSVELLYLSSWANSAEVQILKRSSKWFEISGSC